MLSTLSALNWAMVALYVSVGAVVLLIFPVPLHVGALIMLMLAAVSLPFAYLGYAIEKGRGRTLQTIFAVLSLFNFPLGTAFGAFALWVCWSAEKDRFDFPEEDGAAEAAPSDEDEEEQGDPDETPYDLARGLVQRGIKAPVIRQRLEARGPMMRRSRRS